ncbi:Hypothetical predicted protein [Olea europaea subsp. europaea]|uniref:Uncharacterized protein n=1 Tax=Olea europaea subsp. europaea TaxID=158383 RepID=A0A8S0TS42_OLEEU|nr:Hypothetical predicted protein [Olea europaea subsp. europaea]
MVSGQGQTSRTERCNYFTWLHRNYKKNPNHDLIQYLDAMEKIYRRARANGYQFHRDEIVYHLDRTLTPYWKQFIKGIEETFDDQTPPNLLLRCIRERWRVNCEDVRDTSKMPGYEPNPGNVITIPEVDYKGIMLKKTRVKNTTLHRIPRLIRNQIIRKKKWRVLGRTLR